MSSERNRSFSPLSEWHLKNHWLLGGSSFVKAPASLKEDELSNDSRIFSPCEALKLQKIDLLVGLKVDSQAYLPHKLLLKKILCCVFMLCLLHITYSCVYLFIIYM